METTQRKDHLQNTTPKHQKLLCRIQPQTGQCTSTLTTQQHAKETSWMPTGKMTNEPERSGHHKQICLVNAGNIGACAPTGQCASFSKHEQQHCADTWNADSMDTEAAP